MKSLRLIAFFFVGVFLYACDIIPEQVGSAALFQSEEFLHAELVKEMQGVDPTTLPAYSNCQVAEAWVEANPNSLPTELSVFQNMPPALIRATLSAHSPETKSYLWKAHLEYHYNHTDLKPSQKERLSSIIPLIEPSIFGSNAHGDNKFSQEEIFAILGGQQELIATFGEHNIALMFTKLGSIDRTIEKNVPISSLLLYKQSELDILLGPAFMASSNGYGGGDDGPFPGPPCDCAGHADCGFDGFCGDVPACRTNNGCGMFGGMHCDGSCSYF